VTVADKPQDVPITELFARVRAGDNKAFDQVYSVIYEELRRLARARRRKQSQLENTLNTTALVHETYLKLCRIPHPDFKGREHFLAVAASAMRQILVDEARRRLRTKRGGGAHHESIVGVTIATVDLDAATVLTLHGALEDLRRSKPHLERVIVCRFFGGMTEAETATALERTDRTIRRDWVKARAWLRLHLESTSARP
jgi:RNA polymerase sigma factor (TIGR02999 family)